jgi:hypothetical protein
MTDRDTIYDEVLEILANDETIKRMGYVLPRHVLEVLNADKQRYVIEYVMKVLGDMERAGILKERYCNLLAFDIVNLNQSI